MRILPATPAHADDIARLIMMAMSDDCCQYYAGADHNLDDFYRMMRGLVLDERSQYSYVNTLVALTSEGRVAGACVAYDGGRLHELRRAFVDAAAAELQMDWSHMDDETAAGEYYVDSLAVYPAYRRQGIAPSLLMAMSEVARRQGLPLGLLVDCGNPNAERMYASVGFRYAGDARWGGHPMRHLLRPVDAGQ